MKKVHVRQTKNGLPACAVKGVVGKNSNMIFRNSRTTYQFMCSEVVSVDQFRETPSAVRCAHCSDKFTAMMNARRSKSGKPLYKNAFTKELINDPIPN